jgi:hypothetical protein
MHNARVMATPKPGEIRCPTCHRSTPPAAFCTQCGSAIPSDARARPRGMDRDELQDRIRARRSGSDPYRRGSVSDEAPGYERFEPEPDDKRAQRMAATDDRRLDHFDESAVATGAAAVAAGAGAPAGAPAGDAPPPAPADERPSLTRDPDDWEPAPSIVPPMAPREPEPPYDPAGDAAAPYEPAGHVDNFDDAAYAGGEYSYDYDQWEPREERSGSGALAIVGFLALGVLALLGGALLAGVFGGDQTGQVGASPSVSASAEPTASPTAEPTPVPTDDAAPSGSAAPSGGPIVFPDGFTAEAQPCLPGSANVSGCDSNAVSNAGSVWVWVGFQNGTDNDVVGARVLGPDGTTVGEGSIDLRDIGCRGNACNGWTYFPFSGLPVGTYGVEVLRNGEPAGETSFEVS